MVTLSEFITFLTATYYVNFTKKKHCCVSVATIVTQSFTMVRHTQSATLLLLTFNRNDVEMALDILISLPGFLQSRQANSGTMASNYK
jgi:hypothetical protein